MMKSLPYDNFIRVKYVENLNFNISDELSGYVLELELEYPGELHVTH